jgi:hypothetical protein
MDNMWHPEDLACFLDYGMGLEVIQGIKVERSFQPQNKKRSLHNYSYYTVTSKLFSLITFPTFTIATSLSKRYHLEGFKCGNFGMNLG